MYKKVQRVMLAAPTRATLYLRIVVRGERDCELGVCGQITDCSEGDEWRDWLKEWVMDKGGV